MATGETTKRLIAQGAKQLLAKRPFSEVSVGEIVRHCNVSRNTFYYYFKDKYDLISWIFHSEIGEVIGPTPRIQDWSASLLKLCRYLQANREFYINVLRVRGQNSFTLCMMEFYTGVMERMLGEAAGQRLTKEQAHIAARFYAHGLTGVVMDWARAGMQGDSAPTVHLLEDLLSGAAQARMEAARQTLAQDGEDVV